MIKNELETIRIEEVANILGISRATAYNLVKQDDFPKIRIGRRIIIPVDAFNDWMKANTEGAVNQ